MGNWRIEITGVGSHDNGLPTDADAVARLLPAILRAHGQNITGARFAKADGDGFSADHVDLLVPEPDAELNVERAAPEHIMQFFAWAHLPPALAGVSAIFGQLAEVVVHMLPRSPERTVALRKLLEGKDAAVRARVAKGGAR
jgi:hypothetical protein